MPLHLLRKKSWNVYNQENISRVQRDEAQAKAEEEQRRQQSQQDEAESRIRILRGEQPYPSSSQLKTAGKTREPDQQGTEYEGARYRKRRRLAGEDDTDRDIRFAREDAQTAEERVHSGKKSRPANDAPIVDESGHVSLFPEKRPERSTSKPATKGVDSGSQDQQGMRFSDAAGYQRRLQDPWYSSSVKDIQVQVEGIPSKDVWGNEDPRRRQREAQRLETNDPLLAMKKGVRQLREVERERTKLKRERDQDLKSLIKDEEESKARHRRRHRHSRDSDSLENFRLDSSYEQESRRRHREDDRKRTSRRHDHDKP